MGVRLSPGLEPADRWPGVGGRAGEGMERWASSPVTWEARAGRSSRQRGRGGSRGFMINWRSGRPAVLPQASPGAGTRVTAVPSPAPGPHRRPRTCRPLGAPRCSQLSKAARVERWKMLWVGSKGLKGQRLPGCREHSEGQKGRGRMGSRRVVVFLSLPRLICPGR